MTIHISAQEPRLDAYDREYINLVMQRRKVMQHPTTWWLRNRFAYEWGWCAIAVILLAFSGWLLCMDRTFVPAIVLTGMAALLLLSAARLIRLYHIRSKLKRERRSLDLTLDPDGVAARVENERTIRFRWEEIAFFRVFKECACFLPYEKTDAALIVVSVNHASEIVAYLREHRPDVRIIGA